MSIRFVGFFCVDNPLSFAKRESVISFLICMRVISFSCHIIGVKINIMLNKGGKNRHCLVPDPKGKSSVI